MLLFPNKRLHTIHIHTHINHIQMHTFIHSYIRSCQNLPHACFRINESAPNHQIIEHYAVSHSLLHSSGWFDNHLSLSYKVSMRLHQVLNGCMSLLYVCMYICMYVCLYVCMFVRMHIYVCVFCVCVCVYVCMHEYMLHVRMCVCHTMRAPHTW